MLTRRSILTAAASLPAVAFLSTPARAAEPETFTIDGIAIRGADPVAFFTEGAPVMGSADHALMWQGATWYFASADNMELFLASPETYAPQYGGYCAFALARGSLATSVPEAWSIVDDKLYLNYSINVRQVWNEDIPGNIARGDANWPSVLA